jgi:trimethylamine:corrinoid methyltransferase-like protein
VGGSHLETDHTYRHYREALVYPDLLWRGDRERWEMVGAKDIVERAHERVRDILAQDRAPLLTDAQEKELAGIEAKWREVVLAG